MTKEEMQRRIQAIKVLVEAFPELSVEQANKFQDKLYGLERRLSRNAVDWCNGDVTDEHYREHKDRYHRQVKKVADTFGVSLEYWTGGDCRGGQLHLMLPTKVWNTWGGEEDGFVL